MASGGVVLSAGGHPFKVLYGWSSGTGYLELYWKTPKGARTLMGPDAFLPARGAWPAGSVAEPPAYTLPAKDHAQPLGSTDN